MVYKKRAIDRLRGQAGQNMPENPQNHLKVSDVPNRLSQKGYRQIHTQEYIHSLHVHLDEHFIKFAHDDRPFVRVHIYSYRWAIR